MPRAARAPSHAQQLRHNPLGEDYSPSDSIKKKESRKRKQAHDDSTERSYVDSKASRRILDLGQALTAEDDAERTALQPVQAQDNTHIFLGRDLVAEDSADEEPGEYDDVEVLGDEDEIVEEIEIDPEDQAAWDKFNPSFDPATLLAPDEDDANAGQRTNLADLILEKIAAHEAQNSQAQPDIRGGGHPDDAVELPAKVVEVYTQVGTLLSRYKSGKLPKPFKILPTLPQWDILLAITRPDAWTPHAVYEATRLFVSSRPALAQAFCSDILLPRVRDDIRETKKLNVHLYKAMKKALYKPAAFFRGLLFPLTASGTCTLREATIVSSVLARVSIPVLHSATALYRLCEIAAEQMMSDVESAGACNIFIRTLLEKKYALPYRVVDALVFHFLRFRSVQDGDADLAMGNAQDKFTSKKGLASAKLPVLWHQSLLAFAQRYKNEITEDQREALLDLLLVRAHKQIGPEVRRELLEGRGRGELAEPVDTVMNGGDDTMIELLTEPPSHRSTGLYTNHLPGDKLADQHKGKAATLTRALASKIHFQQSGHSWLYLWPRQTWPRSAQYSIILLPAKAYRDLWVMKRLLHTSTERHIKPVSMRGNAA